MTKAESKVIDFIKKHILLFLLVAVTIIAIFLRVCGMDFQSDDFNSFLNSWWSIIKLNDFTGLATQVGNYNIPYQIIIYLMTLLPLNALYAYKIVSIIFDFVLAISTAMLVYSFAKNNRRLKAILTYSAELLSATVIFNSSFWAQSLQSCFCTKTSRSHRLCSSALRLHSSCKPYSSFPLCFITGFRQRKFRFCISL